jgi:hypothetical protein
LASECFIALHDRIKQGESCQVWSAGRRCEAARARYIKSASFAGLASRWALAKGFIWGVKRAKLEVRTEVVGTLLALELPGWPDAH